MPANSIKTNLCEDDIISDVLLMRNGDIKHRFSFIILEGEDDICFFENFVSKNVFLYESFSGKSGVIELIDNLNFENVIGIVDKDYDTESPNKRIFFYDRSCLETMVIGSKRTFHKTCSALCPGQKNIDSLYEKTFRGVRWLSILRKISFIRNYDLDFKAVSIAGAFNIKSEQLDIDKVKDKLLISNKNFFEKNKTLLQEIDIKCSNDIDLEELILDTQGHDCLNFFHCLLKPKKGKDNYSSKAILRIFFAYFKIETSSLYSQLIKYFEKYELTIFEEE